MSLVEFSSGDLLLVAFALYLILELIHFNSYGEKEKRTEEKKKRLKLEERIRREAESKKQFAEWHARRQKQIRLAVYIGNMDASRKPERVWKPERAKLIERYLSEMRVDNPAATLSDAHEDIVEVCRTPIFSTW
jgi:hypothetical protein